MAIKPELVNSGVRLKYLDFIENEIDNILARANTVTIARDYITMVVLTSDSFNDIHVPNLYHDVALPKRVELYELSEVEKEILSQRYSKEVWNGSVFVNALWTSAYFSTVRGLREQLVAMRGYGTLAAHASILSEHINRLSNGLRDGIQTFVLVKKHSNT
jgi:hypothetical protein